MPLFSQDSISFFEQAESLRKKRFKAAVLVQPLGYGGLLVGLSSAWYSNYQNTSFHLFDDSREWLQMDKVGHLASAYYITRIGIDMMHWSGMRGARSVLYPAISSVVFLTGIEVLDGFSSGWGFSSSDMAANLVGVGFAVGQGLLVKIKNGDRGVSEKNSMKWLAGFSIKYSYHPTMYASLRPELLGNTFSERMLKDYNGQSYWVSYNLSSFKTGMNYFPKWLNLAFGYGGEGMISGSEVNTQSNLPTFERYRQYYLSLDIDLSRIKTRSHFIKTLAETFCFIKIPAPTIEFGKNGIKSYLFYY